MGFQTVMNSLAGEVLTNARQLLSDVSPLLGVGLGIMVLGLILAQLRRFM